MLHSQPARMMHNMAAMLCVTGACCSVVLLPANEAAGKIVQLLHTCFQFASTVPAGLLSQHSLLCVLVVRKVVARVRFVRYHS